MKITIDSGALSGGHAVRGIGFYTRNLIAALEKQKKVRLVEIGEECDVIHYPYIDLFFRTLPMKKLTRTVVTIHDVIPLIYPKKYPAGIRGRVNFWAQKFSLKTVSVVITDTEASKKDIVRFLGVSKDKIEVIHLAPANRGKVINDMTFLSRVREKYNLPHKFALYVGDVNYNKNVANLVRSCAKNNLTLVVVGKQAVNLDRGSNLGDIKGPMDGMRFLLGKDHPEESHYEDLMNVFEKYGVLRLGFVEEQDLVAIYNLATVYCQPSLYEGFGLPPLEAMMCGCPVVASRTQALVEVCDEAALFFDPKDINDMADKIKTAVDNLLIRKKLVKSGKEVASKYSWKKVAKDTIRVYEKAVGYE